MSNRLLALALSCPIVVTMPACDGQDGDPANDPDASDMPGSDAAGELTTLIESTWTIEPGEFYRCERLTVAEDTYIAAFEAIGPPGTHHTVLTVGAPTGPDGAFPCNVATNADASIFGSGVGTTMLAMPDGVAMKVAAGQQLLLNLHLFNTTDAPMTGTSGTRARTIPASDVDVVAESVLMGRQTLTVPVGESTQIGTCRMNGDVTVFAVAPHMHQLGTHMMVEADSSTAGEVVLHDGDYDFLEQRVYEIESVELKSGDPLRVHCTYDNDTGGPVSWGDSSLEEMCYAGIYRYPAFGGTFGIVCAD